MDGACKQKGRFKETEDKKNTYLKLERQLTHNEELSLGRFITHRTRETGKRHVAYIRFL